MSHHDGHSHHGHESSENKASLSDIEKLFKMVEHWIHHNGDHARSYREWALKAQEMGREDVSLILEEVAARTDRQSLDLEKVLGLIETAPPSRG